MIRKKFENLKIPERITFCLVMQIAKLQWHHCPSHPLACSSFHGWLVLVRQTIQPRIRSIDSSCRCSIRFQNRCWHATPFVNSIIVGVAGKVDAVVIPTKLKLFDLAPGKRSRRRFLFVRVCLFVFVPDARNIKLNVWREKTFSLSRVLYWMTLRSIDFSW